MIKPELRQRILAANLEVHAVEADVYERLHSEIYNWYEQKHTWNRVQEVSHLLPLHAARNALDIGCGTGNLLFKLAHLGFEVMGIDISKDMLDIVSAKGYPADMLLCMDIDSYLENQDSGRFDVITISSVLHHLPDYLSTLSGVVRLLRMEGALLITHEPVARTHPSSTGDALSLKSLVSWMAACTQQLRLIRCGIRLPPIDYTFSDYHAKLGIPVSILAEFLEKQGLKIIRIEYYSAEKAGWAAFLNNHISCSSPKLFALIAQKRSSSPGEQHKSKQSSR